MQIIDNKALLLKVKEPERITAVIQNAKKLSDTEVLVRWGVEEAQILKNLGSRMCRPPLCEITHGPVCRSRSSISTTRRHS